MDSPIIQTSYLNKSYDSKHVLKNINLDVYPGQVIGYIGPNGAGKSTTVKILTGLIPEFDGEVQILGHNLKSEPLKNKKTYRLCSGRCRNVRCAYADGVP